jgi:predicted ArsR family transcriptional regulator
LITRGRDEWKERISRMAQEGVVRSVRDISATGRHNAGRPNNRWSGSRSGNKELVKGRIE